MIDIHPAHHAASTWRDFFIHIATIVLGLLIAIGLEQTVELIHRHRDARASIQMEIGRNKEMLDRDQKALADTQKHLAKDLDLLNSSAPNAQVLSQLEYKWNLTRRQDAAWNAARIDGSLALIPPGRSTTSAISTRALLLWSPSSSRTSHRPKPLRPFWTTRERPAS